MGYTSRHDQAQKRTDATLAPAEPDATHKEVASQEETDSDILLVSDMVAANPKFGEANFVKWTNAIERDGRLSPKRRALARKLVAEARQGKEEREAKPRSGDASADLHLLEEAREADNDWIKGAYESLKEGVETHGAFTDDQRNAVWRVARLHEAKQGIDLREIIAELYPDAGVNLGLVGWQDIRPVWRSETRRKAGVCGDAKSKVAGGVLTDYPSGESWNWLSFMSEVAGLRGKALDDYLLFRAGFAAEPPQIARHVERRAVAAKEMSKDERLKEERKQAWVDSEKEKHAGNAKRVQESAPSGYMRRKQVEDFWQSHWLRGGALFGFDDKGRFTQVEMANFKRATGLQRIYDGKVIVDEDGNRRDKDFIGDKKGSFLAVIPNKLTRLPKDAPELAQLQRQGYTLDVCEGLATALSICAANPKVIMLCAFDAGNLVNVCEAVRAHYGYEVGVLGKVEEIRLRIWRDDDRWMKNPETKEKIPVKKPEKSETPQESNTGKLKAVEAAKLYRANVLSPVFSEASAAHCPTDFNDLHVLEGLGALRLRTKTKPKRATRKEPRVAKPQPKKERAQRGGLWRDAAGLALGGMSLAMLVTVMFVILGNDVAALGLGALEPMLVGWRSVGVLGAACGGAWAGLRLIGGEAKRSR